MYKIIPNKFNEITLSEELKYVTIKERRKKLDKVYIEFELQGLKNNNQKMRKKVIDLIKKQKEFENDSKFSSLIKKKLKNLNLKIKNSISKSNKSMKVMKKKEKCLKEKEKVIEDIVICISPLRIKN